MLHIITPERNRVQICYLIYMNLHYLNYKHVACTQFFTLPRPKWRECEPQRGVIQTSRGVHFLYILLTISEYRCLKLWCRYNVFLTRKKLLLVLCECFLASQILLIFTHKMIEIKLRPFLTDLEHTKQEELLNILIL